MTTLLQTGNGNGNSSVLASSGFIFPQLRFDDEDYARIKMRLDLYTDYILATKYDKRGQSGATFMVDPADLASAVSGLSVTTGLLPRNALFWGKKGSVERIGVYLKPQVWPLSVNGDKLTWHIPLPGMIFIGEGKRYELYAVKEYPVSGTTLFNAPVPNLSNAVCTGNVSFPKAGVKTIWQAVDAFFQSGFNNHLANGKSRQEPENILRIWRLLKGEQEYPLYDLVEAGTTIKKITQF
jgi:hypothetical protein